MSAWGVVLLDVLLLIVFLAPILELMTNLFDPLGYPADGDASPDRWERLTGAALAFVEAARTEAGPHEQLLAHLDLHQWVRSLIACVMVLQQQLLKGQISALPEGGQLRCEFLRTIDSVLLSESAQAMAEDTIAAESDAEGQAQTRTDLANLLQFAAAWTRGPKKPEAVRP
jgi:hypothetical protein